MEDLQSSALPLGYAAVEAQFTGADSICPGGRLSSFPGPFISPLDLGEKGLEKPESTADGRAPSGGDDGAIGAGDGI